MADTDISEDKSREQLEEDIREMRADFHAEDKGRGKLFTVALVGGLVTVAAAGGGLVFFAGDESQAEIVEELPVIEAPRNVGYIDLEPIFIQVETDRGRLQNVVVALALEVEKGSNDERRVVQAMPRLYEAYLRTLTDRPLPGAADGNVEVTHIKNRIRAENLRLLGAGAVNDVILRNIWVTGD